LRLTFNIINLFVIVLIASSALIAGCSNISKPIQSTLRPADISCPGNPDTTDPQQILPGSDSTEDQGHNHNVIGSAPTGVNSATHVQGGVTEVGSSQKGDHSNHSDTDVSNPARVFSFDPFTCAGVRECQRSQLLDGGFAGEDNDSVFEKIRRFGISSIRSGKADSAVDLPVGEYFFSE